MSNLGIAITQEGIDVSRASDYQKVLDSRWLFFEVVGDYDETIVVPGVGVPQNNGTQRVDIVRHKLARGGKPYVPAFHASWLVVGGDPSSIDGFSKDLQGIAADNESIYFYRNLLPGIPAPGFKLRVRVKVYSVPILKPYTAPTETAPSGFKRNNRIGARALDGTNAALRIGQQSPYGFSIDTRKKILSVHKVIHKDMGYHNFDTAMVSSIDLTENSLIVVNDPNGRPYPDGRRSHRSWVKTGVELEYNPADLSTFPSPLYAAQRLFAIVRSDGRVQLAASAEGAYRGEAIDLTSAGSLPARLRRVDRDDGKIEHGQAYPPSYLFCKIFDTIGGEGQSAGPLYHNNGSPIVLSDSKHLIFRGVQSIFIAKVAVIIIKDPIEVAR